MPLKSVTLYHVVLLRARHGVVAEGRALAEAVALSDAMSCVVMAKHLVCLCFNLLPGKWDQLTSALLLGTAGLINDGKMFWFYGGMGTQRCRKMGQSTNRRLSFTSEGQKDLIEPIPLGRRMEGRKGGFSYIRCKGLD